MKHQDDFPSPIEPPNDRNWFHVPIAIPVILDGVRPKLQNVFVNYKAGLALITNLHIWDGSRIDKSFNNLALTGDHSTNIDIDNSWDINPQ